jgi:hypothetical protein
MAMKSKLVRIIPLFLFIIAESEVVAQEMKPVSGIVTSFKMIPLNKVKVIAEKSGKVAYTDSTGRFALQCFEKDNLKVTASGFKDRNIKVGKQNTYAIDLPYSDNVNNFNYAVNNGHIKEKVLRQAIDSIQLKNVKDYSKYTSIYELINSEIYEVSVKGNGIFNKKIRSMNLSPQVLYVVNDRVVTDISFVNTSDVKTIEFIDDVGTTMWGMQGANGVLKITLK